MPNNLYLCKRSSILIVCLWSLTLLSLFAVYLGANVRQKMALISRLENISKLRFVAEAGVIKAVYEIKKSQDSGFFALNDNLANNPGLFGQTQLAASILSINYNHYQECGLLSGIFYGLNDEQSKINLNRSEYTVLSRLFIAVLGISEAEALDMACAVVDWRDKDGSSILPGQGAEDSYYGMLDIPYECKDNDFEALEELLLVKHMTQSYFDRLRDFVTIYGDGKININTAPWQTLLALGLTPELSDKVIMCRSGKDKMEGTLDDIIFKEVQNISAQVNQFQLLSVLEQALLQKAADNYLIINTNYFMVKCLAQSPGKGNYKNISAVVDRSGKIYSWREM
ncbi:MAG: hypothetical protein ABIG46_04880 [Candidatus Omnitrophota bacterium]